MKAFRIIVLLDSGPGRSRYIVKAAEITAAISKALKVAKKDWKGDAVEFRVISAEELEGTAL